MDRVLPAVRHVIELAEDCANLHDEPVFDLPASFATPADVIATLVYAVWRGGRRGPGDPVPTVELGARRDKPPKAARGRINTHPIAVLGSVILCPGATAQEVATTHPFVMRAIGGLVAGEAKGEVEPKSWDSVRFWLDTPRQQEEHGYTVTVVDGRYYYDHRPPGRRA